MEQLQTKRSMYCCTLCTLCHYFDSIYIVLRFWDCKVQFVRQLLCCKFFDSTIILMLLDCGSGRLPSRGLAVDIAAARDRVMRHGQQSVGP